MASGACRGYHLVYYKETVAKYKNLKLTYYQVIDNDYPLGFRNMELCAIVWRCYGRFHFAITASFGPEPALPRSLTVTCDLFIHLR